jgi:hypothetical protein
MKLMDTLSNRDCAGQFPTLLDMVEARTAGSGATVWWGPVIGADEPSPPSGLDESAAGSVWWGPIIGADEGGIPVDGIIDSFSSSPCLIQDEGVVISDRRLKADITDIGTTVYGLPLYRFRYRDREGVYEGVMADDVLRVKPSAVLCDDDGFLRVNYRSLGLEMRRVA